MMRVPALFLASAVLHAPIVECVAGSSKALRASHVSSKDVLFSQDDHVHLATHHHRRDAGISLMTIASKRSPGKVHRGGHRHKANNDEEDEHFQKTHPNNVGQHNFHVLHATSQGVLHKKDASNDETDSAQSDSLDANVVVHIAAADANYVDSEAAPGRSAVVESKVSGTGVNVEQSSAKPGRHSADTQSTDGEQSPAGEVLYDSDATDGSGADAEDDSKSDRATADGGAAVINDAITEVEEQDKADETAVVADLVVAADSEGEAETEVAATTKAGPEAAGEDVGNSEVEVSDSEVVSEDVDAEDAGDSEDISVGSESAGTEDDSEVIADSEVDIEDAVISVKAGNSEVAADSKDMAGAQDTLKNVVANDFEANHAGIRAASSADATAGATVATDAAADTKHVDAADIEDAVDTEAASDIDAADTDEADTEIAASGEDTSDTTAVVGTGGSGEAEADEADTEITVSGKATTDAVAVSDTGSTADAEVVVAAEPDMDGTASAASTQAIATDAEVTAEKEATGNAAATHRKKRRQPAGSGTAVAADLPGRLPGQDGEVLPAPVASDDGDGARTVPGADPGSLNIGSSEMQAADVGAAVLYHDGSTQAEDWAQEYGRAAQEFHDKVEAGEKASGTSRQRTADGGSGGSGSMALALGLVIILGLLACALGLGTKI